MDPFSAFLSQNKKLIIELIEIRMLLESEIARLAAKRITPLKISKLQKTIQKMRAEIDAGGNGLDAENAFHDALADASENQALKLILGMCSDMLSKSREATLVIEGQPERTLYEHSHILEAVRQGDSALAAKRMKQHLVNAQKNLCMKPHHKPL